ncbi:MAG: hypothetical protein IKK81_05365 [Prevotella sp.]|nr:hypothetical protein [Prevotella sp.]
MSGEEKEILFFFSPECLIPYSKVAKMSGEEKEILSFFLPNASYLN